MQIHVMIVISLAVLNHYNKILGSPLGNYITDCNRLPKPTYIVTRKLRGKHS